MGSKSSRNRVESKIKYQREVINRQMDEVVCLKRLLNEARQEIEYQKRRVEGTVTDGLDDSDDSDVSPDGDSDMGAGETSTGVEEASTGLEETCRDVREQLADDNTEVEASDRDLVLRPEDAAPVGGEAGSEPTGCAAQDSDVRACATSGPPESEPRVDGAASEVPDTDS